MAILALVDWRGVIPLFNSAWAKALSRDALEVTVVGQTLSLSVCALALRVLSKDLTLPSSWLSRWCRDGVGALPVTFPGLGEAAGIRVLVLFGVSAGAALVVSTADILAETISQAIYAITAVSLAPSSFRMSLPRIGGWGPAVMALGVAVVTAIALALRYAPSRLRVVPLTLARRGWALLQSRAFAASLVLHLLAWVLGGAQIYVLAQVLGGGLNFWQALSLEGIVFALRAAFFFVPAGVGVQEVGLAAVGASYGLAPVETAAIAVLLRLRDVIVLGPGVLIWVVMEVRRAFASTHAVRLAG